MKVITFSTRFPATHPRAGQPTYFVEKIVRGLHEQGMKPFDVNCDFSTEAYHIVDGKHHTIRAGHRWKEGEWFSPRIWSGKPYASKQIEFAPPIQIKKIWTFDIVDLGGVLCLRINDEPMGQWHPFNDHIKEISKNDGLTAIEMIQWFNLHPKAKQTTFKGQILCWSEHVNYSPIELQNHTRSVNVDPSKR